MLLWVVNPLVLTLLHYVLVPQPDSLCPEDVHSFHPYQRQAIIKPVDVVLMRVASVLTLITVN